MHRIEQLIDMSVWTGHWPFAHLRYGKLELMEKKLRSINVGKAFVAPSEAILEKDPMRANMALSDQIRGDFFSPVHVIDLSYGNWKECMEAAASDGRVAMIKLLPNYHRYELDECKLGRLTELTGKYGMIIAIQIRVEDKRLQYPLMQVNDVEIHSITKVVSRFPEQIFILNNIYMHEIRHIIDSNNVYMDIACIEQQDTLEKLSKRFTLDRFVFSSHCPFLYPEGSLSKLKGSRLGINEINKVANQNAGRIRRISRGQA